MPTRLVAVIEDEPIIALELTESLQAAGYQTWSASSADAAVQQAKVMGPPDAVIMDISLRNRGDGIVLVETLRALLQRKLPVVFSTGYVDQATKRRASACEPIGYFIKPTNPTRIVSALQLALPALETLFDTAKKAEA